MDRRTFAGSLAGLIGLLTTPFRAKASTPVPEDGVYCMMDTLKHGTVKLFLKSFAVASREVTLNMDYNEEAQKLTGLLYEDHKPMHLEGLCSFRASNDKPQPVIQFGFVECWKGGKLRCRLQFQGMALRCYSIGIPFGFGHVPDAKPTINFTLTECDPQ